jgi:ABC-type nitrate/sulfonate/bicarbonate transport system ATPase subunit
MIHVDGLSFSYPASAPLFKNFSFEVEAGAAWAIVGASGCGKTTLLNILAGLLSPDSGSIVIEGSKLKRPRPRTGLVLQEYGLLPWATVRQNTYLGLRIRALYGPDGVHSPVDENTDNGEERVAYWLKRLGIDRIADQYPHQVSGGQRQRTAIARTLVMNPDLLLMDEPFGALDLPTRIDLQNLTMQLRRETNLTSIIVTHNIEEAAYMGERILVLTRGPHTTPHIAANPGAGKTGFRNSEDFRATCAEIGRMIGEDGDEMA